MSLVAGDFDGDDKIDLAAAGDYIAQGGVNILLGNGDGTFAATGTNRNVPKTVALLTGGEYFKFENTRSLERGLVTISNQVPNTYALSFSPQQDRPGLHVIDVRLKDRPGLRVEARKSYWADGSTTPN